MIETKKEIVIDESKYYFIITKDETKVEFALHNAELLFIETLTSDEFQNKIVEYNTEIEDIDSESFLEEISKTFCGSIDSKINIENRSDEEFIFKFNFKTEGIPLAYKFKLRNVHYFLHLLNQTIFKELLMQREKAHIKIIHDKDLELAEYKKSGLKLSRRDLATNEFVPDKHKINYAPSFRSPQEMLMRSDVQNFVSVVEKTKVQKQDSNSNNMKAGQTNAVKSKKARHYEQRRAIQANLIAPSTVVDPSHQNKKALKRDLSPGAKRKAALAKKLQNL